LIARATRRVRSLVAALLAIGAGAAIASDAPRPLGDGRIAGEPRPGFVFLCDRVPGRSPPLYTPWIRGREWHPREKVAVQDGLTWPDARVSVRVEGDVRVIGTNGLPTHPTGRFPIEPRDPAYRHDRNPNRIRPSEATVRLPALPDEAPGPSCLPMGPVGYALTGAAVFNALDAGGKDAVANEVQDRCGGHPSPGGQYHYHGWSECMDDASGRAGRHSDLVGYALDGFGLYGPHGEQGAELGSADLDACHGHSHEITWDGQARRLYHYHLTRDYPYTVSCFTGTPIRLERRPPPPPR
jgi:hypothetical protein